MDYITAADAAEKWGVSQRQVHRLLAANRITGVKKYGKRFLIPADAEKPGDPRFEKNKLPPENPLSTDLAELIAATTLPMPRNNPDAILETVKEERQRRQYEAEFAYLRGDYDCTIRCWRETAGDDAARLRAASIAIAAAISTGDYHFYTEVEAYLKSCINVSKGDDIKTFAEFMLTTAYTGAIAPNMVPEWLKNGDFTALPAHAIAGASYMRVKYFQCLGQFEAMLAAAQTALAFCETNRSMTSFHGIYLRVACTIAYAATGRKDDLKTNLQNALRAYLPHGFIIPFAESATLFGGLLEQLLEQEYPEHYSTVTGIWQRTFANWMTFHNHFTKDNLTLILSLREYQIARLVAQHVPRAKIAEQFNISLGGLNKIIDVVYGKLFISNRNELAKYIM